MEIASKEAMFIKQDIILMVPYSIPIPNKSFMEVLYNLGYIALILAYCRALGAHDILCSRTEVQNGSASQMVSVVKNMLLIIKLICQQQHYK